MFEGIKTVGDDETKAKIIEIADILGVTVYEHEIEDVFRMERRDEKDLRPGPVLVPFS